MKKHHQQGVARITPRKSYFDLSDQVTSFYYILPSILYIYTHTLSNCIRFRKLPYQSETNSASEWLRMAQEEN